MLVFTSAQLAQIFEHTQAEAPNEACGLLVGLDQRVTEVLPAANVASSPRVEYLMDPHDQIRHFQIMEDRGLELLGIYHSHPSSPAYPSPTDLFMAYYPEAVYAIISLLSDDKPVLRTFRMVDGLIKEVAFQVMPTAPFNKKDAHQFSESTKT
jgi:proteasome lid subunit RPN8/RPN11